jgi:hypothetical protein
MVYFTPKGEFTHIVTTQLKPENPYEKFASRSRPGEFLVRVYASDELGAYAEWVKFMREQDNGQDS